MTLRGLCVAGVLVSGLCASAAARVSFAIAPVQQRTPPPVQPLPYSHKQHLALPAELECRTCHVNPEAGKLMTYPATGTCMSCHATMAADRPSLQALAAFAASGKPIPWVRVYQLPDYVYWKHATHVQAAISCTECHGAVAERDVIGIETGITSMRGCVTCHDARQVYVDCGDCHEPRQ